VRKEIKTSPKQADRIFAQELRNLSLLSHLKHPNLVELFCSYQYRGAYNFIFAEADGGTLAQMLRGEIEVPHLFSSSDKVWIALADLSSAIDTMHNFSVNVLDLKMTGCHHDLAPRNIFIRDGTFILGDFGLSTFKSQEENSLTAFKEVRSDYAAPECQRFQRDDPETGEVTRASDIWSFGCILAELITFVMRGSDGVTLFRQTRRYDVTSEITWYRFHHGPARASPVVLEWLTSLRQSIITPTESTITLIEEMLSLEAVRRPKAAEVLRRLRCTAILEMCRHTSKQWSLMGNLIGVADLRLGKMNFEGWSIAFETLCKDSCLCQQDYRAELTAFDFRLCETTLRDTCNILQRLEHENDDSRRRIARTLQWNNIQLLNALPAHYRILSKTHLEQLILQDLEVDVSNLDVKFSDEISSNDLDMLVAVKLLMQKEEKGLLGEQNNLFLKDTDVKVFDNLEQHSLALFERTGRRVLVEWVQYTFAWTDDIIGQQFRERVASVAALLHNDDKVRIPKTLRCQGYFHSPSRRAFGLVCELPSLPHGEDHAMTLFRILHGGMSYRPALEGRARLGWSIAQAIYQFHSVGWLHRNLNPTNVVFFPGKDTLKSEWVRAPYLLGFANSRQNEKDAATLGPVDCLNYHNPEYLQNRERFREEYDYYSLGMLLLEIGHWAPLTKITAGERFHGLRPELYRDEILRSRLSQVGLTMGSRYMRVVQRCLSGNFSIEHIAGQVERGIALRELFKREVVDCLYALVSALE
jgi:serine/threonine protein kinase